MTSLGLFTKEQTILAYYEKNFKEVLQFNPSRKVPSALGNYATVFQKRYITIATHAYHQPQHNVKPYSFIVFVGLQYAYPAIIYIYECIIFSPDKIVFRSMTEKDITDTYQIIKSI